MSETRRIKVIRVPVSPVEMAMVEWLAKLDGRHGIPEYIRELIRREAANRLLEPSDFGEEASAN